MYKRQSGVPDGPNKGASSHFGPEIAMWRCVMHQVLFDATSPCKYIVSVTAKTAARSWLLYNKEDFTIVCDHAQLEPSVVRKTAREMAANNWPKIDTSEMEHERRSIPDFYWV